MATFGFVHGAYHGSWCWDFIAAALTEKGHRTFVVDLPTEDPAAGASEYAEAATLAFEDADADLILVGHSLAGLTIPIIANRRPTRKLVYVSAMLPRLGRSHNEVQSEEPDMLLPGPSNATNRSPSGATVWKPTIAAQRFFADCSESVAFWAAAQLRGQCWKILSEESPLTTWPDIPSTYMLGKRDLVLNPQWARRVVPRVLRTQPVELESGHAPFLSIPEVFVELLLGEIEFERFPDVAE